MKGWVDWRTQPEMLGAHYLGLGLHPGPGGHTLGQSWPWGWGGEPDMPTGTSSLIQWFELFLKFKL